ncbi:hypothetical protein MSSAC_2360 [Methanosarcina siciliae C2J]|uniref:YgiT-type zinc finger domain protein n=1 Tax=Methanosarcina siciliae C2J TaxID=1434118 RepID=A0A0E3PP49_9EURY|nr:type II toxin-antitoxin system MqsA family antitoxin [Methanosarcina siciliae]AKB36950.1 hypothetical protein MSSAC_2360 [Methanosarcina siciliae C2J]
MKPYRCVFCKSKLVKGKTEFVAKVGEQIIAIKDVSAYICENCGEAYYTPEVSRNVDMVMKRFHESKLLLHPVYFWSRLSRLTSFVRLNHSQYL